MAEILQQLGARGIILERLECPYCKTPTKLPVAGDTFQCQACGSNIKLTDISSLIKDILGRSPKEAEQVEREN